MSSLMACLGCRDRDLVVLAMEVLAPWKRRMRLMARLRRVAMISGPLPVRSWWWSSSKMTSLTDVETVLDSPVPLDPGRDDLGLGIGHREGADQVDHLDALAAFDGSGASELDHLRSPGEVHPGGSLNRLGSAPHPPPVTGIDA